MARRKGKKKAGEEYLLLYHLSRTGIIPRSDLSLYRGNQRDRYIQRLIVKHIDAGHIKTTRYYQCDYCYITEAGIEYLRKQEKDVYNYSDLLEEYREYLNAKSEKENPIKGDVPPIEKESPETESGMTESLTDNPAPKTIMAISQGFQSEEKSRKLYEVRTESWAPQGRETTRMMNSQRRMKFERLEQGIRGETFRAELRQGSAENLLHSAGVLVYPEDKPGYKTFLSELSSPNYANTFLWQCISEHGVFYSRRQMVTTEDQGYHNRMLGVLFTKSGWYVVYNTLERFSRWLSKWEADGVTILSEQMRKTKAYQNSPSRSLVFAVGKGMVAAMVSGYKHGHNRRGNIPDALLKKWRQRLMTVEEMETIFRTVYLAELNSNGISSLAWLVGSDNETLEKERRMLVTGNPEIFKFAQAVNGTAVIIERESGKESILSQIFNLTELKRKRDGTSIVNYVGPPWMAEATAKSLGRNFGRFISLYGEGEIAVHHYDEYGEKITTNSPQVSQNKPSRQDTETV